MSDGRLDRLLWRHEYGQVAPEVLQSEFRDVIDRHGDAAVELLEHAQVIRLWHSGLLTTRVHAFNAAVRAIDSCRFREALRQIRIYEMAETSMRELLRAVVDADRADDAVNRLCELVPVARLR